MYASMFSYNIPQPPAADVLLCSLEYIILYFVHCNIAIICCEIITVSHGSAYTVVRATQQVNGK